MKQNLKVLKSSLFGGGGGQLFRFQRVFIDFELWHGRIKPWYGIFASRVPKSMSVINVWVGT